jgi:hypothetical protein
LLQIRVLEVCLYPIHHELLLALRELVSLPVLLDLDDNPVVLIGGSKLIDVIELIDIHIILVNSLDA